MKGKYLGTGRRDQKLKTRDRILASTQDIIGKKKEFTLEDVAKQANISRATIYRYYSSIDILTAEAVLDLNTKSSEEIIEEVKNLNLKQAILAIQEYYNNLTIDHEAGFRKYMSVVLNAEQSTKMRGARRKKTLLMLLQDRRKDMSPEQMEKLANMATILMGIEPFVVTKDVCHLDNEQSKEILSWSLDRILDTVLT
ncbi:TetR/AcrR family transcriptional regulator [Christiangramia sabulilitoris]|uniref:TetR/AcrR family transcriptional regulator n=1 Tax=Christiangramia sabulilitoris TaxID=2583991 RepID=A0A550HZT5_9FLAO|nr:TetR/AcrR family transcriptional regulator [Christiangramia sabulilitoris]TRO64236.1 TetR/AcrR family transcriptional regulator [Christiangramia sabulilitoris]